MRTARIPEYKTIPKPGSRVAIVGAGLAGLTSAWLLARDYRVTLFEARAVAGGHAKTVEVELQGKRHDIDTGLLVFNERGDPNLTALFDALEMRLQRAEMSFGVSVDGGRLEWAAKGFGGVFAQRRSVVSPPFLGMLVDIMNFKRQAGRDLIKVIATQISLAQMLALRGYGRAFRDDYLLPMAAAIWRNPGDGILQYPAASFLRYYLEHELSPRVHHSGWWGPAGGTQACVQRLLAAVPGVRLATPVFAVRRDARGVVLASAEGDERFDAVVLAIHAPDARALLSDASEAEAAVLNAVRYQTHSAYLHADRRLLPIRSKVWSACNYLGNRSGLRPSGVSYLINKLQPLPFDAPLIMTLNPPFEPASASVFDCCDHAIPLLDHAAVHAQARLAGLQGLRQTWFAGGWTGAAFVEDEVISALRIAADFGVLPSWAVL